MFEETFYLSLGDILPTISDVLTHKEMSGLRIPDSAKYFNGPTSYFLYQYSGKPIWYTYICCYFV